MRYLLPHDIQQFDARSQDLAKEYPVHWGKLSPVEIRQPTLRTISIAGQVFNPITDELPPRCFEELEDSWKKKFNSGNTKIRAFVPCRVRSWTSRPSTSSFRAFSAS